MTVIYEARSAGHRDINYDNFKCTMYGPSWTATIDSGPLLKRMKFIFE